MGAVEDASNDNLREIAEYMGEMFALYFEEYVDMELTVSIGNEISAYYYDGDTFRLSAYKIFPIIVNDSIIGMVDVVYKNGDITNISVGRDYSAELNNAIVGEETAFAIIFTENGVYVAYEGGDTQIVKSYYNEDIPLSISGNSEITYESIAQTYDITAYD